MIFIILTTNYYNTISINYWNILKIMPCYAEEFVKFIEQEVKTYYILDRHEIILVATKAFKEILLYI
jgi:hypothetical protein